MKQKTTNVSINLKTEKEVLDYFVPSEYRSLTKEGSQKYKITTIVKQINRNGFNRKRTDLQKLKDTLWKLVSEYIRRRDKGICFTCGLEKPWKEMHPGHFIPQSLCNTDSKYAEWNIHCQCYRCNINLSSNNPAYKIAMEKKYGTGTCKIVERQNKEKSKWIYKDYEESIEHFKELIDKL